MIKKRELLVIISNKKIHGGRSIQTEVSISQIVCYQGYISTPI